MNPAIPAPIAAMALANSHLSTLNPANNPPARITPPIRAADFSSKAPKKFWITVFKFPPSAPINPNITSAPPKANINPAIPAPIAANAFANPIPIPAMDFPRAPTPVPIPPNSPARIPPDF